MTTMTYDGYVATIDLDEEAGLFHGEVINTRDVLTFQGRSYPFTLTGELNGLGALSGIEGGGEVYNLRDVSQFAGAYIQGASPLAAGSFAGDIWLKNAHGVIIRLSAQQNGITVSSGRYAIFVQLGG